MATTKETLRVIAEGLTGNETEEETGCMDCAVLEHLASLAAYNFGVMTEDKYVSELLGKETIDTNTYGKSTGRSGNYSTNYQNSGRELLMPDEVRMMDNQYALLFIRGERPVKDLKYDILKHPNIKLTEDGGASPFIHGNSDDAAFSIELTSAFLEPYDDEYVEPTGYELLSEMDLQERYLSDVK